ncbi:MAG: ABC transporter substrate-binding protein [Oscillospiraceae bacterium]|jgi:oligopeptide transport system substrate-binding protein|nr:ABC transporter substrate-binding protein [Oscillospiraceae bacterium]
MKKLSVFLILVLTAGLFSSCASEGDGSGQNFNLSLLGNPENLDPQLAADTSSFTVIKNIFRGLFKYDRSGRLVPDIAEEYSQTGLTYRFKLKDNVYWYAKNHPKTPVTADDFVFGFQRLFAAETSSPYAEDFGCIENVTAAGDTELEITLKYPNPNFTALLASPPSFPCNRTFFSGTKGRYGLDKDSVVSNGAFYMTQWFYDRYGPESILWLRRHPHNSTEESADSKIYPRNLYFTISQTREEIKEMFDAGETDFFLTDKIYNEYIGGDYEIDLYEGITAGILWNTEADRNLRDAFAMSLDLTGLSEHITPAAGIVPPMCYWEDKPFRELVPDSGNTPDFDGAAELFSRVKTDTSIKILAPENCAYMELLQPITLTWQDLFGIYVGFEPVSQGEYQRRIESKDFTAALYEISGSSVYDIFGKLNEIGAAPPYERETAYSADDFIELEKSALEENIFLPIAYKRDYLVHNKSIGGVYYDPSSGALGYQYGITK